MSKSKAKKTGHPVAGVRTSIDIRTKGEHGDFIHYCLESLPEIYTSYYTKTDTGFKVQIAYDEGFDGNRFFAQRYLATIARDIRTLDEGNVKTEVITVVPEMESAE